MGRRRGRSSRRCTRARRSRQRRGRPPCRPSRSAGRRSGTLRTAYLRFPGPYVLPLLLRERPLGAVSPTLIVYLDLFLAQVHLDGLLVPGDPLAQPDFLLEHDALGDHDLLLEDLQDHLVLADVGLCGPAGLLGLSLYRHPLDLYLLAPPRDPHHLAFGSHALPGAHPAGLALADAGAEFLL